MNKKFAVLASGAGTTLDFLLANQKMNNLKHQLVLLVTNNSNSGAVQVACRHQLQTEILREDLDLQLLTALRSYNIDFVFLTGFLKKIGPLTLRHYSGRIYNSHPSLLPKYGGKGMYGSKVTQAVLTSGERFTGVTIHLLDDEYDTGKILKQIKVVVKPDDTIESLEFRVKEYEKKFILEFINSIG